ncbi:MAG: beta-ketoacyl-ACP reductase [Halodesulfurarchaeum sp.]
MGMEGRTCVVTGSSRGIGRGIAERFGEEGANVVVNYRRSAEEAETVAESIEAAGGRAVTIKADVTNQGEVQEMRDRTHEAFGRIDVLVNNAGINQDVMFENMTHEEWDTVLDIHLDGTFHATQAFYEDLKEAEEGRLINISSIVGKEGNLGQANYAAAKSGIFGFTRTLALELARYGTTANAIAPGFIKTNMLDGVPDKVLDRIRDDTPLQRLGEIDEIASVVAFVASEEASFMTGEVLDVNGGKDL